jgi:O-antigen/teichoic acid export membrane protein
MTSKGLSSQVLAGLKWQYVSMMFQAVSRLAILSGLAHLLTPKEFGLYTIALLFTSLGERVGQVGIGPALVQRSEVTEQHRRVGFTISVCVGAVFFALLYLSAGRIADFFHEPTLEDILPVISFVFIVESFGMVSEAFLQRNLRFRDLMWVDNFSYLIGNGIVGVGLAWLGYGVWALVGAILVGRIAKVLLLLKAEPQKLTPMFSLKEAKELTNLGAGYSIGRLLSYGALQGDNFVVGRMLGSESLGIYGRGYQLMILPATYLGQVLEKVLFPAMSRKQNSREGLHRSFLYSVELIALLAMPASILMYVTSREIVMVLFGPQWEAVVPVLGILGLGVYFRTAYKSCDTLVRSLGAPYRHASRQAVYALLVIGGAIFASSWGVVGVGWAVLFSVIINYILMSHLSVRMVNLPWKDFIRAHFPGLWVSLFVFLVLQFFMPWLREIWSLNNLGRLIISSGVATLTGGVALLFSPPLARVHFISWVIARIGEREGRVWSTLIQYLRLVSPR